MLDTEGGFGPVIVARLERFRLRTRVDLAPVEWTCVGLRGPGAPGAAVELAQPSVCPSTGRASKGWTCSGPGLPAPAIPWVDEGVTPCPEEAWEAARIESGQPVLGREIDERTIAAEVGLVERTVSFTKGCFTGQELVARLDARGSNVARRLCGLVVEGDPTSAGELVGASVWSAASEAGRRRGSGGRPSDLGRLVPGPRRPRRPCHPPSIGHPAGTGRREDRWA